MSGMRFAVSACALVMDDLVPCSMLPPQASVQQPSTSVSLYNSSDGSAHLSQLSLRKKKLSAPPASEQREVEIGQPRQALYYHYTSAARVTINFKQIETVDRRPQRGSRTWLIAGDDDGARWLAALFGSQPLTSRAGHEDVRPGLSGLLSTALF